ncbi:SDR family NAD(P)-dependent oxidoreductase [Nitrincola iocasae]|jgi:short-subunit dehydrogenase|uniref:SDR family NAD(P)-dependent oxidoreductase n=1 Tax=Nitrincola iocasae TaxID=2614693 RepID=A0A5J6LCV0_9GAMM|nr:SDR family NAD(P)-dependent oxidoreductase [Nitrincola iocasae]QEW06148.1 SDR family NAD(P)-dependent oxidoreductase [Nitrincola iocasae]
MFRSFVISKIGVDTSWKLVWITGGGSGIGLAVAKQLVRKGTKVIISGRHEQALLECCDQLNQPTLSGSLHPLVCDVTSLESVQAAWQMLIQNYGIPDLVLLNAGNHQPVTLENFSPEPFQQLMAVNYFGVVNCLSVLLPDLVSRQRGQIGVVASVAGYSGLPTAAAYGGSKAALINTCEALYPELLEQGIQLSLINPGFVKTPLTDKNTFAMPFLVDADRAATVIIRGLQLKRFEIAFPRVFVMLLKVLRLLPYSLYFRLTRKLLP